MKFKKYGNNFIAIKKGELWDLYDEENKLLLKNCKEEDWEIFPNFYYILKNRDDKSYFLFSPWKNLIVDYVYEIQYLNPKQFLILRTNEKNYEIFSTRQEKNKIIISSEFVGIDLKNK